MRTLFIFHKNKVIDDQNKVANERRRQGLNDVDEPKTISIRLLITTLRRLTNKYISTINHKFIV